jgi:hypothetical protein
MRLREEFGIKRMVLVEDRGKREQKAIDEMSKDSDVAWITALEKLDSHPGGAASPATGLV